MLARPLVPPGLTTLAHPAANNRGTRTHSGTSLTARGATRRAAARLHAESTAGLGLLIECDSVLMDTHQQGHRQAFNLAFKEMGLSCATWSVPVYHDLLRSGDGSPEGLVISWFELVGWPMNLPAKERPDFVRRVHSTKQKALKTIVREAAIPLRNGILEVIDAALAAGTSVGIIANTLSTPNESVVTSALTHLGPERVRKMQIFSAGSQRSPNEEGEERGSAADAQEAQVPLLLEEGFAAAKAKVARTEAMAFVKSVRGNSGRGGLAIGIDPILLANARRAAEAGVTPAWLGAVLVALGSSAHSTALLAAVGSTLKAGLGAGTLPIAVPPTLSTRGTFPSAEVVFHGFGPGGGVTWPRIQGLLEKRKRK